jgi:hypothetical protein
MNHKQAYKVLKQCLMNHKQAYKVQNFSYFQERNYMYVGMECMSKQLKLVVIWIEKGNKQSTYCTWAFKSRGMLISMSRSPLECIGRLCS